MYFKGHVIHRQKFKYFSKLEIFYDRVKANEITNITLVSDDKK